jgi:hypothetical protein
VGQEQWERGRRLGIDVGSVRVGVAVCDPDGILASPVATVARDQSAEGDATPSDMSEILRYVGECGPARGAGGARARPADGREDVHRGGNT